MRNLPLPAPADFCQSSRSLVVNPSIWRLLPVVLWAAALAAAPIRFAHAEVGACVKAHASGQRELRAGHYRVAEGLFQTCSVESCPNELIKECVGYLELVRSRVPTLVFAATDAEHKDLTDVQVYSGEERLVEHLDGRAIPVDPGKHVFRFVFPDGEVVTTEVLVRESDKGREIRVAMEPRKTAAPAMGPTPAPTGAPTSAPDAPPMPRRNYVPAYIGTGVAALGLVGFVSLALAGKNQENQFHDCAPNCLKKDYDSMRSLYLGADIALAVTGVAAVVSTYFYLRPPTKTGPLTTHVGVHSTGAGLAMSVAGTF